MFIVFITAFSNFMLMPVIMIFLQDKFTTDIGQLAFVFLPGGVAVAFLTSRFGQLSDRFGKIRLMITGLTLAGIFSFFIPYLSVSLILLAALWLFFNIATAMSRPAQTAMVSDIVWQERRGRSYGLYDFSMTLGMTLGPLAGGWLYDSVGKSMPFYLNGIILLVAGGFVLLFMRENRHQTKVTVNLGDD
jgi:DHA1 family multidrug resistance protein-like MFS transporter